MSMNKMHLIHMLIYFIYLIIYDSGMSVCGMWTVWEDIDGCAKQYSCDLDINLMTVLSYSYGIIMDRDINAPGHGNIVFDELNAMEKRNLK